MSSSFTDIISETATVCAKAIAIIEANRRQVTSNNVKVTS